MDLLTINDSSGAYPPSYYANHTPQLAPFNAAKGELNCDIAVVGAGFTGLSSAYHLSKQGYDVILLDAQRVGFGASGRNGGQVANEQRVDQDELEKMVGDIHARQLFDISQHANQLVRELCAIPEVNTPFHSGIIHANHRKRDVKHSRHYVDHMRNRYEAEHISFLTEKECRALVNSPAYYGGTLDMKAGHINPLALALGLARLCMKQKVRIFEQSRVTSINHGATTLIQTNDATINAKYCILGCNGYLGQLDKNIAQHVMPINNYIVATKPMSHEERADLIPQNYAVADSKFIVNYFRFSDDNRLLFGGTESYGYQFPKDIAKNVRKPLTEIFPQLKDTPLDYAWGGTLSITMNRMPHFTRLSDICLSLSGYSGSGVAMATLAGQIAAETIQGQAERFDIMGQIPTPRFPGGPAFRSPLMVLAMLWYGLMDRL